MSSAPTAPPYGGWRFVLNPSTAPTYNVDDWQIVFRDSATACAPTGSQSMARP